MLETALFDCAINEKCCSVDPSWGICQLKSPYSRKFTIQSKKNANARGSAQGGGWRSWNWLMHNTRKLLLHHLRKRIHVMNKIKRVWWSYVYCTLDIDGPWFWNTDIKVIFLFERRIQRICSIGNFPICNCGFGIWVNCDGIAVFLPPLLRSLIRKNREWPPTQALFFWSLPVLKCSVVPYNCIECIKGRGTQIESDEWC